MGLRALAEVKGTHVKPNSNALGSTALGDIQYENNILK
jgi:hypothetical protein